MSKNDSSELPIKASGEKGIFSKFDWMKEADGKLVSAKLLRECANQKRAEFDQLKTKKQEQGERCSSKEVFDIHDVKESANKSSVLMLGYAIELLLKAGVVSLFISAPKNLLEKRVKRYSHDLLSIAIDLHLKLSEEEHKLLDLLSSYIIRETRYPVTPKSLEDYCDQVNSITSFVSNDKQFSLGISFFNRLRKIINDIDGTPENIKFYSRMEMEVDGFITFRIGGPLPPMFIVKYCSTQVQAGLDTLATVKALLLEKNKENKTIHSHLMEKSWDSAVFYRVGGKKGLTGCSR